MMLNGWFRETVKSPVGKGKEKKIRQGCEYLKKGCQESNKLRRGGQITVDVRSRETRRWERKETKLHQKGSRGARNMNGPSKGKKKEEGPDQKESGPTSREANTKGLEDRGDGAHSWTETKRPLKLSRKIRKRSKGGRGRGKKGEK